MGGYEPVAMRVVDDEKRAGAAEAAKARKAVSMWITEGACPINPEKVKQAQP